MGIGQGLLPDYVSIERKSVKHLRLAINRDGSVRLVLPQRVSLKAGLAFYQEREHWVASKRRQLHKQKSQSEQLVGLGSVLLNGDIYQVSFNADSDGVDHQQRELQVRGATSQVAQMRVWRNVAAAELRTRLQQEAERLQVRVNKVSIRDQKSRWGSCSARGNISLNWRVALMPPWVGNYIIAHEFAHLRHLDHSPAFWREVERLCPNYRRAERWLKAQGAVLMLLAR